MQVFPLRALVRRWPRAIAAIAFGAATAGTVYFAWVPEARTSGFVPLWAGAVGVAHAIAGSLVGARLVDGTTRTGTAASLTAAGASSLAVAFVAVAFAIWVGVGNAAAPSVLGAVVSTLLIGLFAFVTVGWALVLVCAALGWVLYRLA